MTRPVTGEGSPGRRTLFWLGLLLAALAAATASYARLAELTHWNANPDTYFVNGIPVMTTEDAYYDLRWAKAFLDGTYAPHADDPLRHYQRLQYPRDASEFWPGDAPLEWREQRQPRRLPLLSRMIAATAPLAGGVERAGLLLTPVLAGLFIVPMFLYGWRIGQPAAGLLGGLVGAFAPVYLARTQLGYVDTDCLNLFFPWLASLLIVSIGRDTRTPRVLLAAAALGLTLYGYFLWYEKPALSALYWATLGLHLLVQRRRPVVVLAALALCVACSHPVQAAAASESLTRLVARYLAGSAPGDGISAASAFFPNVAQTIGEQRGARGLAAFAALLHRPEAGVVGLLSFAAFAVLRWRQFLPLIPLAVMAAFAVISGPRFAMYLAPLAGMGLGLLVAELTRRAAALLAGHRGSEAPALPPPAPGRSVAASYVVVLALFALWLAPPTAAMPRASAGAMPAEAIRALQRVARQLPGGTPAWTWWDHGFAIAHIAGLGIYHDGGAQYTPQTNVIAHAFMAADQQALHRTMGTVDRIGNKGIAELAATHGSREALLQALAQPGAAPEPPREIALVFTRNMLGAASALRYVSGLPIRTAAGAPIVFEPLRCTGMQGDVLRCAGFTVDLASGAFSDGRAVRRLDIVDNGRVVKRVDYPNGAGFVLELVIGADRRIEVFRVPDELYASNLNRMFLLGEYDPALFEQIDVEAPVMRAFRRKPPPPGGG